MGSVVSSNAQRQSETAYFAKCQTRKHAHSLNILLPNDVVMADVLACQYIQQIEQCCLMGTVQLLYRSCNVSLKRDYFKGDKLCSFSGLCLYFGL